MLSSLRRGRSTATARPAALPDTAALLAALPNPLIVLDRGGTVRFVNPAAEQFFGVGAAALIGHPLAQFIAPHSPLFALADAVWRSGGSIAEYDLMLEGPRFAARSVTIEGAPAGEGADLLVLTLHERWMADKMDRQLTQLICDETDRIVALVDRMEAFAGHAPINRDEVNIHEVLDRVRKIAQSGFARHVRVIEDYDPSLPPVHGDRDLLLQVFLNLVKNAAEAAPSAGGEIVLTTGYRHGLRLAAPGGDGRRHLPLMVSVSDNGGGIPDDLKPYLFDPFVTTKRNGTGLGLALVAKVIGDHGGVIEFDSQPRRTVFRVFLPVVTPAGVTPTGVAQNGNG